METKAQLPVRIVVKFKDETPRTTAEFVLSSVGLCVVHQLAFAPNLFVVAPTTSDPVDINKIAGVLSQADGCEFAEPEIAEPIGSRDGL